MHGLKLKVFGLRFTLEVNGSNVLIQTGKHCHELIFTSRQWKKWRNGRPFVVKDNYRGSHNKEFTLGRHSLVYCYSQWQVRHWSVMDDVGLPECDYVEAVTKQRKRDELRQLLRRI